MRPKGKVEREMSERRSILDRAMLLTVRLRLHRERQEKEEGLKDTRRLAHSGVTRKVGGSEV